MAFHNVIFKPGPLGSELTTITGQAAPDIKLDQAMTFKVADGRVTQSGLNIPIGGNGLRVAIEGSVGFDETLDLKATSKLSAKALGLAGLSNPAGAATITVPIRGTLNRPAVDQKALTIALRNAARVVGEKQLKSEAGRLLERLARPNLDKNPQ
jgi:translocation and assembly module TamB